MPDLVFCIPYTPLYFLDELISVLFENLLCIDSNFKEKIVLKACNTKE
jgi:hypothetical protein